MRKYHYNFESKKPNKRVRWTDRQTRRKRASESERDGEFQSLLTHYDREPNSKEFWENLSNGNLLKELKLAAVLCKRLGMGRKGGYPAKVGMSKTPYLIHWF